MTFCDLWEVRPSRGSRCHVLMFLYPDVNYFVNYSGESGDLPYRILHTVNTETIAYLTLIAV